ncbi:MAG: hypothetical protein KF855_02375 [Acidobacteria bacterium]|nr:hypothetical protein [Acidobacteriota bacterium]
MVKRTDTTVARDKDKKKRSHFSEYASVSRSATRNTKRNIDDDLIVSLANAYENKRVRQVIEWEKAQAVNIRQAI